MYGIPVEREGITVIPVARVRYGFGGGTQAGEATGLGLGAGVSLTPVGYVERREGRSRFPAQLVVGGAAGGDERGCGVAVAAGCAGVAEQPRPAIDI